MGFLNSTILDWAIGIIFVYLLLAIICTSINEWIAGLTSARANTLSKAIRQLLDNQTGPGAARSFLDDFYAHPLVSSMMTPNKQPSSGHPSYLPARTFATAVMDVATSGKAGSITLRRSRRRNKKASGRRCQDCAFGPYPERLRRSRLCPKEYSTVVRRYDGACIRMVQAARTSHYHRGGISPYGWHKR